MTAVPEIWGSRTNLSPGQSFRMAAAHTAANSTSSETQVQRTVREAGVYSLLCIKVWSNGVGADSTIFFRKGAANGSQNKTIPASTIGEFEDASNTDTVAAADLINTLLTVGAGGTSLRTNAVAMLFAASSNTSVRMANQSYTLSTASTTFFIKPAGQNANNPASSETLQNMRMKTAGTIKNMCVAVSTNGRGTDTVYRSRLNGADGGLTVTVTANTTGNYEDTSGSDTVVVDNLICRSGTTGTGTGNIVAIVYTTLETTDGTSMLLGGNNAASMGFGATNYFGMTGFHSTGTTTETEASHRLQLAVTLSQFVVNIGTNSVNADSTWRLRKNAGNVTSAVTITANTNGWYEDTTNSDTVLASDLLDYQMAVGGSAGTLTLEGFGCKLATSAPAAGNPWYTYAQQAA